MLKIEVKNGNVEQALKKYKSKVAKTKLLKKLREGKEYIKPATKNRIKRLKIDKMKAWKDQNTEL